MVGKYICWGGDFCVRFNIFIEVVICKDYFFYIVELYFGIFIVCWVWRNVCFYFYVLEKRWCFNIKYGLN